MSSDAIDAQVDLDAIVDRSFVGDVGIPDSSELLAFVTAVHDQQIELNRARVDLIAAVGHEGLVEAAATVAVFNGLVRVADGTGIRLDDGLQSYSETDRARLGIDGYAGAANTTGDVSQSDVTTIGEMFG